MSESKNQPAPDDSKPPSRRGSSLGPMVAGLAALQVGCRVIPEFRPGLGGVIWWMFGLELVPLAALVVLGVALVAALFRRPFWTRRRLVLWGLLLALTFSNLLFVRYPSSFDGKPSQVSFRLPLDGPITIGWGGGTPRQNYHGIAPEQSWAYDLLVTREGKSFQGKGDRLEDYSIYDRTILSPAGGEVVASFDGDPDMPIGQLGGGTTPAGNHVVIKVAEGEYLWICHMKPGTTAVKPGDWVKQGDVLGRVGNSGNTSEPHLHTHLQSTPDLGFGEGIPLPFDHYKTADGRHVDRGIPTGGINDDGALIGEIVSHDPLAPATPPEP